MRTGYFECFSGISGDMVLGALVDAGVPFARLEETAAALKVGARLEMRKVLRGGIAGTKVDVIAPGDEHGHAHEGHEGHGHKQHSHEHHGPEAQTHAGGQSAEKHAHAAHRSLAAIVEIIGGSGLSEAVKARATRAFELLGEAEAGIHAIPVEQVHFHEVGAVDTIVDIVCAAAGCELLGVERWVCSALNVGSGTVECQHGTLPVPAPATLALLGGAPVYAAGTPMERVTPTGAAILRMLEVSWGTLPAMRVTAAGYGAGGREVKGEPNLLRLVVGEETEETPSETVAVIETVIDDSTPQLLAYVSEQLLEAGAWDVYRTGVQMKKGRNGVQLTVLCGPERAPALRELIFRETTTIGLRWRIENKAALEREFVKVRTPWGAVCIKVARWASGKMANASPEYEDCRKLAREHGVPLKQVMQEAMRAFEAAEKEGRR